MASQAEVDLIISTDDTLPQLERDLTAIVRAAEAGADDIELEALLDTDASISNLINELSDVVAAAERAGDVIAVEATLDSIESLENLQDELGEVIHTASARAADIQLEAELDANEAALDAELTRLVQRLERDAPDINLDVDVDRDGRGFSSLSRFTGAVSGAIPEITRMRAIIAGVGLGAASLAPTLAATVASLEAIAPASALAVSGLITVGLAAGTLKLAFSGVGDAVKAAFDPDAKPEDLAKAMEKLAPSAREFVTELSSMRKNLSAVQQQVQQKFFAGLSTELQGLGSTVLPVVAGALTRTSEQLNLMAKGASQAAQQLAKDGTLGKALDSSVTSLGLLKDIPAQFVTGLGQIGAAAGPSLERVAAAAGKAGESISKKLTEAFETGRLEAAISGAVDVLKQLGRIASNIFSGLGNIIGTVTVQGNGLFFILEKVSKAFKDVTASKGFQDALTAVVQTLGVLVDTVLPLVTNALQILGPVFQALASPVQLLVLHLGKGLNQVLTALGPVLVSVANAFGKLVNLVTPLIGLAATLIAAVLPALIPLFDALGQTFVALTPVIEQLVEQIAAQLVPIFTTLATEVLPQLLPLFVELATSLLPVLLDIMVALAPTITKLAETFAELLVELTPLIVELLNLAMTMLNDLLPVIQPLIDLILKLVTVALAIFTAQIRGIVIPVIRILTDLLKGDFSSAWRGTQDLIANVARKIGELIGQMKDAVVAKLREMGSQALERIRQMVNDSVAKFNEWKDRLIEIANGIGPGIRNAVGNLGSLLVQAGRDAVQGLINGLTERLGRLREIASDIASTVVGAVTGTLDSHSPSRVMMQVGRDTIEGFKIGISDSVPSLRKELQGVASLAPSFAMPGNQSLSLAVPDAGAPTVNVYLGNQLLDQHVDTRITMSNKDRDRLAIQGVRR